MTDYISPDEQRLIIEKLYYSDDSITSLKKFNKQYKDEIGRMGERTMSLYDFGHKMKKTDFKSFDVERFTLDITGKKIDLETL